MTPDEVVKLLNEYDWLRHLVFAATRFVEEAADVPDANGKGRNGCFACGAPTGRYHPGCSLVAWLNHAAAVLKET